MIPATEIQGLWEPETTFLDTASFGLPPRPAFTALQEALAEWRSGRTSWEGWAQSVARSRSSFARLVGCSPDDVAAGATVSELIGIVAASLPDGARVLVPEVEFTSNLFPWLAHGQRLQIVTVPLGSLVNAVDHSTTLVAVSAVQSSDGRVADLAAIADAARDHAALVLVDATQACGWLPLHALDFDFLVCHTYKWLLSPRGAALMVVRPQRVEDLVPLHASWWAAEDPYGNYYRPPLRLAHTARRLDTSPAWFSWVGTAPALDVVEQIGVERIHAHDVELANRFRLGLGLEPDASAIVSVDTDGAAGKLERAGVRAAVRAGGVRVSFHLYNTTAHVDAALEALVG